MTLPTLQAGKNFTFEIEVAPASGVWTDLTDYIEEPSLRLALDMLEATTGGGRNMIPGFEKSSADIKGPWSPALDNILGPLFNPPDGLVRQWRFFPAKNSSGKPKYAGTFFLTEYPISGSATGLRNWSARLDVPGNVTRTVVT